MIFLNIFEKWRFSEASDIVRVIVTLVLRSAPLKGHINDELGQFLLSVDAQIRLPAGKIKRTMRHILCNVHDEIHDIFAVNIHVSSSSTG
jgi:hypothetical protein